ncbi:MAG: DUF86 domain-containing protein, partial [Rhizobiaceae bacterium]
MDCWTRSGERVLSNERGLFRVDHIKVAIGQIRGLLDGHSLADIQSDLIARLAFERLLQIISEASRGVPDEWKVSIAPAVNWRRLADLGNRLRHVYDAVDLGILWGIYTDDLDPLEAAIDAMIAA